MSDECISCFSSVCIIIVRSPDIGVVGARRDVWRLWQRPTIEAIFEDRFDTLIWEHNFGHGQQYLRVRNDFPRAMQILAQFQEHPDVPAVLRDQLLSWINAL